MRKPVDFLAIAAFAAVTAAPVRAQNKDIVDTAVAARSFEVLVKLVQDAGLVAVLRYHVLTSAATAEDFRLVKSSGTAMGKRVAWKVEGGTTYVNDTKIVTAGIDASNGVIHVVDKVLIPPK